MMLSRYPSRKIHVSVRWTWRRKAKYIDFLRHMPETTADTKTAFVDVSIIHYDHAWLEQKKDSVPPDTTNKGI